MNTAELPCSNISSSSSFVVAFPAVRKKKKKVNTTIRPLRFVATHWSPIDVVFLLYTSLGNQFVSDCILSWLQRTSLTASSAVSYVFSNRRTLILLALPARCSARFPEGMKNSLKVGLCDDVDFKLTFSFPLTLLAFFLISAIRSSNSCLVSVNKRVV